MPITKAQTFLFNFAEFFFTLADFLEAVAVAKKAAPTGRFPVSEKTEIIVVYNSEINCSFTLKLIGAYNWKTSLIFTIYEQVLGKKIPTY